VPILAAGEAVREVVVPTVDAPLVKVPIGDAP